MTLNMSSSKNKKRGSIPAAAPLAGQFGKTPVPSTRGSFSALFPKFSLIHVHGKYPLRSCQKQEKSAILDTLYALSRLTWGQIWSNPRERLGAEPLPMQKYKEMPVELQNKSSKYIIFRFSKKGRIIGFHEADTLYIVWFDPKHDLC